MFLWEACSKRKDEIAVARGHTLGYRRLGVSEGRGEAAETTIFAELLRSRRIGYLGLGR